MADIPVKTLEIKGDESDADIRLAFHRDALGGVHGDDTVNVAVFPVTSTRSFIFAGRDVIGTETTVLETEGDEDTDRVELRFLKSQVGAAAAFGTQSVGTQIGEGEDAVLMLPIQTAAPPPPPEE